MTPLKVWIWTAAGERQEMSWRNAVDGCRLLGWRLDPPEFDGQPTHKMTRGGVLEALMLEGIVLDQHVHLSHAVFALQRRRAGSPVGDIMAAVMSAQAEAVAAGRAPQGHPAASMPR